tara:strand:+ start:105 stop:212 length:108 start_codon:yes stop_codon:yes gene_type:complete
MKNNKNDICFRIKIIKIPKIALLKLKVRIEIGKDH